MSDGNKPLVLIIDDEPQIRRLLVATLEVNGFRVLAAASGQEGLVLATQHRPAVVILDLGLPDLAGQDVLRRLREWSNMPVVILSVQDDESGKVAALDAGADDYVTKPFNSSELLARLRVALRHASKQEEAAVFQAGHLVVDLATRRVTVKGREVKLTVKEYDLLRLLVRHAGKVLTHRQILRAVWGLGHDADNLYLRVYVARLREKIEADPARPVSLITEPGVGYRFVVGSAV
jgi:two-component system, OmpR family, KDP operon response regulator KdpE